MARLSAADAAAKWQRRLSQAGQDITNGVNSVQVSPGQKAADQMQLWLTNIQASAPRWQQALRNMSLQSWQQAMISKGVPRITAGAANGVGKMQNFMTQWLSYESQVVAALPPRGDLETNLQRANAVARANAQAKGQFRQGGRSK